MNLRWTLFACLCAAGLMGCASSSPAGGTQAVTVADGVTTEASEGTSDNAAGAASVSGDTASAALDIAQNCRTSIQHFIRKTDGSLEILTEDGVLRNVDVAGNVKVVSKLSDSASNYQLLPTQNVILHYHPDRIMLENTSGQELFKLAGDPAKRQVYYSNDAQELAILNTNGKFNVWNAEKGFGGIEMNERVQDFINRQSPDHQLGFPGDVRALGMGKNGFIAVAMDTPSDGKVGLLYLLDSVNAPGALKNMGRTNTPVKEVMVSASAEYLAAIDEPGQLYFTSTSDKGFIMFAQGYKDVKDITMHGNNPILVRSDKVVGLDYRTGLELFEISGAYDKCDVSAAKLFCAGNGVISIYHANDGRLIQRFGFNGEQYAVLQNGELSGTCK